MTIRALIFDFDGLILDTESPDWESWRDLYREHGAELELARYQESVGTFGGFDPAAHLEQLLGSPVDRAALSALHRERVVARCVEQRLLAGVQELIDHAVEAGLRLAVASSSDRAWVRPWLEKHGLLDRFGCVRTRDDVARPKPAPDLYLSAARCLEIAPPECVALEDSLHGLQAAIAAGMRCVVVPTIVTASLSFDGAALRLGSLAELAPAELLARLAQLPVGPGLSAIAES